ncbi:hypothetical protein DM860_017419 [Cuscuta australis]|uniref:CUE domain-containing protein n=2 Tax=Cuscuta sect. Cleistogrammica TaxID=1824901 RepID=A0A328CY68_9ASTE|nr:hypothetical protein DM860_017419 [Cuscuta australis]
MGFKKVYYALQEIFPEIDSRVLRAVSIEHCMDPDAAVEAVLMEVIPFFTERTVSFSVPSANSEAAVVNSSLVAVNFSETLLVDNPSQKMGSSNQKCDGFSSYDAIDGQCQLPNDAKGVHNTSENLISFEIGESSVQVDHNVSSELAVQFNDDKCASIEIPEPFSSNVQEKCASKNEESEDIFLECVGMPGVNIDGLPRHECSVTAHKHALSEKLPVFDSLNFASPSIVHAHERCEELAVDPERQNGDPEEMGLKSSVNVVPDINVNGEVLDADLEFVPSSMVTLTRSSQSSSIDLLEDIISEAKSSKKTMFAAMESLICLMKEVDHQEKAAEQADEESAIGGHGILQRVDHLKEMLKHAKEANDMHAGEVYGEKAILTTEVKELQSRLLNLADERDKSLAILDEMRQILEVRLDAAKRNREAAEYEKMQKEELARNALAEQELIMEKVVRESNILKQEAEENSKLQEFLVDRGRVVDMLQGEISVICQDVRLLKMKFDNGVPLSESFSSGQTSCILASSNSSLKSMTPEPAYQAAEPINSSDEHEELGSASQTRDGEHKDVTADDDWEIFDNQEFCT